MIMPRTITPIATANKINITLRSVRIKKIFNIPTKPEWFTGHCYHFRYDFENLENQSRSLEVEQ